MIRFLCLLSFLVAISGLFSQHIDLSRNYYPIESAGPLPPELSHTAYDRALSMMNGFNPSQNSEDRLKKEYISNYIWEEDEDLKSGEVLYNHFIGEYLNKIADVILKNDTVLRKKIRIYPIRRNVSNAWAYDDGSIFISLDYIARYQTEAQLAMTLCHEICHFTNQHTYKGFLKSDELRKKGVNEDTIWKRQREFYKLNESQADMEGFNLLKKSGYNIKTIPAKFDLMLLSEFSFENQPFDISYFNDGYFKINPAIFYKEIKPIVIDANYDDTWHTHPNIYKRKKAIEDDLKLTAELEPSRPEGEEFIVGKDEFNYVRDICRFESCRIDMKDFDFASAVYHAYCLDKKYPDNLYLEQTIGESLYQMAMYKSFDKKHGGYFDYLGIKDNEKINASKDSSMGYVSQVKRMFKRLNGEDFTLLAINYNYKLYKKLGSTNEALHSQLEDLFTVLSDVHNFNYKDFYKSSVELKNRPVHKSDSLKMHRNFVDAVDRKSAFIQYMPDAEFRSFFKDTTSTNEFEIKYISTASKNNSNISFKNYTPLVDKKIMVYNPKELKDVDTVVIVPPVYKKYIYRNSHWSYFPMESHPLNEYFFKEQVNQLHNEGISTRFLDNKKFSSDQIQTYNDLNLINDRVEELLNQDLLPGLRVFSAESNGEIRKRYGTPYILLTYLNDVYLPQGRKIPLGTAISFRVQVNVHEYHLYLVNIETGKIIFSKNFEHEEIVTEKYLKRLLSEDVKQIKGKLD